MNRAQLTGLLWHTTKALIWCLTVGFLGFSATAFASICVDTDGDGWGWDGYASCRMLACPDPDGDGWGWIDNRSCQVAHPAAASRCSAIDANGWGWDGTQSCRAVETTDTLTASVDAEYFLEIALDTEYGGNAYLKKWQRDLRVQILGSATAADRREIERLIAEINPLINHSGIRLLLVNQSPNVTINFLPEHQFAAVEPSYLPVNMGFFWARWTLQGSIQEARIMVSSDMITQAERSHLIREELTQVLGLMNDSWRHIDSIFYQGWTTTREFSNRDRSLITTLYSDRLSAGMTRQQVSSALAARR